MMVAIGDGDDGGTRLFVGLTNENLRRLVQGKPIHVTRAQHGTAVPEGLEVVVLYGETEASLLAALRLVGLIGPDTEVRVDPRLTDITNPPPGGTNS